MIVLTGREFRANQSKYLGVARSGEDVVVKSRAGSFRIVPIADSDIVIGKDDLSESLYKSLLEIKNAKEGKGKLLSWEEFRHEMER
jgi:antitoxin (DNA-binding transcriptional repressor) of toxin-antitoxin stability system